MDELVTPPGRASDRWVTPWVVVVLIAAGTVVVLAVLAAVTYLTARGFDPQPIVQLVGTLVAAAASAGTFLLNLAGRRTVAKVERNTGRLGTGVEAVLEELDASRGRHAPGREETPGSTHGSDLDQDAGSSAGPLNRGPSYDPERYPDTPGDDLHDTAWFRQ
jgi:hypothetical protein